MIVVYREVVRRRQAREAERRTRMNALKKELRLFVNPLTDLTDEDFMSKFRLSKGICKRFMELILPHMTLPDRDDGLSREDRFFCALRFFSVGCYQVPIGQDVTISMSQPSVSRSISEVAQIIVDRLADDFIKFPMSNEWNSVKRKFFGLHGFPGIIGAIDCTHIHIKTPKLDREHVYYAVRKAGHTKNCQVICDADLRILNVNARYGGSTHDSYIWNNSIVHEYLKERFMSGERNFWLIGDSGYGQQPWMMTPLLSANSPQQERYNSAHKRTRAVVERCFGVLKARFRCLSRERILMYSPEKAGQIITACCVLHNVMIEEGYPLPTEELHEEESDDQEEHIVNFIQQGREIRTNLINTHF